MRYLLLFIAWVVALGAMHFTYGLARLLDPVGLMAVFLPLMMCIVFHVRSERVEWSALWLALGVPLGLLAAVAGFIWLLGAEGLNGDYQNVYPTAGIMLTTVLYGGVASAIGYFKLLSAPLVTRGAVFTLKEAWFMAVLLLVLVYLMFQETLLFIWNFTAFSVVIACIISAIAINPQTKLSSAASAAIFASLLLLVLGIIYFYFDDARAVEPIMLATVGLAYGLIAYMLLYFISLTREDDFINVSNANWHWLELCAFLIFMLYAPETIREIQQDSSQSAVDTQRVIEN